MMMAAVYYSMLLTDWLNPVITGISSNDPQVFWIKIIAQWFTILIYVISLIAPIVFEDRIYN